ncbi:hypothetical protein GCM10009612_29610 [Streptomyces beijiangensis]
MQNFSPSTEERGFPPAPPTGAVDKKPVLTCENWVFHRFHRTYYYYQLELAEIPVRSGACAQLGTGAPEAARRDLTPTRTE